MSGLILLVFWSSGLLFLALCIDRLLADLRVGGVSYVEMLLLFELWDGERLVLEKAQ